MANAEEALESIMSAVVIAVLALVFIPVIQVLADSAPNSGPFSGTLQFLFQLLPLAIGLFAIIAILGGLFNLID